MQERSQCFETVAEDIKRLVSTPPDADLLELYALYKQVRIGDCNTERPGILDLKGQKKWDAWNKLKGMSQEDAELQYISKAGDLIIEIGMKKKSDEA